MDFSNIKDVDIRDLVLFIKRRCFATGDCKDCKLMDEDKRCFFDSQTLLYEGEKPNGELYKSIKLMHPCNWDFSGLSEEGWDGDVLIFGKCGNRDSREVGKLRTS